MKAMAAKALTQKELIEMINLYKEQSQPVIKILIDFMRTCIPKMIMHPNGKIECQYPDEYWTLKKQVDEYLSVLQSQIFGEHNISVQPTQKACG
uniref:Uncharacterized protein n=1 Tax=viral metagenome TaxID=1070528 RepID=A0A6H1ZM55_9ZZZZ